MVDEIGQALENMKNKAEEHIELNRVEQEASQSKKEEKLNKMSKQELNIVNAVDKAMVKHELMFCKLRANEETFVKEHSISKLCKEKNIKHDRPSSRMTSDIEDTITIVFGFASEILDDIDQKSWNVNFIIRDLYRYNPKNKSQPAIEKIRRVPDPRAVNPLLKALKTSSKHKSLILSALASYLNTQDRDLEINSDEELIHWASKYALISLCLQPYSKNQKHIPFNRLTELIEAVPEYASFIAKVAIQMSSPDLQLRIIAVKKIGAEKEFVQVLKRISTEDPDKTVREAAWVSLKRNHGLKVSSLTIDTTEWVDNNHDFENSLNCFADILKVKPEESYALWGKGASLMMLKDYTTAIEYFDKALEIDNKLVGAWNDKGVSFYYLNNNKKEKQCYEKALKIDPNAKQVLVNIGLLSLNLKQYPEARNYFNNVLSIDPKNFEALNGLGNSYFNTRKYRKAVDFYDKAMDINPDYLYAPYNKGLALRYLKNYDEALIYLQKALEIDPKYGPALCEKMRTLKNLNRNHEALKIEKELNDPNIMEICLEKHLEYKLMNNLEVLKPFGFDLELISQQETCMDGNGRMDLFCKFKNTTQKIVIELKNVQATKSTFNQIHDYIEFMTQEHNQNIMGLIISRGQNTEFKHLIVKNPEIQHLDLKDIGFE